jgi:3-oxoacyl-[acyl-carrier protein] reductase
MFSMKTERSVALVTGGSKGIGKACALAFAQAGVSVVVNYNRSAAAAEEVVKAVRGAGGEADAMGADVSDDTQVRGLMDAVQKRHGRLDYLINNAGWSTRVPHAEMEALTDEIWEKTLRTNLHGPFSCVRAAAALLRESPGGAIVNIASMAAIHGRGSSMVYAASKGGLLTMTRSLARVFAPAVRVNAVAPGLIRTGFAGWGEDQCVAVENITPLRRLPTVEDIAETALFLAMKARSITGETVWVDGGFSRLGAGA